MNSPYSEKFAKDALISGYTSPAAVAAAVSKLSVHYIAYVLSTAIEDPKKRPLGCFSLITGCAIAIKDKWYPDITIHHYSLLLLLQKFIMAPRSLSQRLDLNSPSTGDCCCQKGPPAVRDSPVELHYLGFENSHLSPASLSVALFYMADLLSHALLKKHNIQKLYNRERCNQLSRHDKRFRAFPVSCDDLMPFEPTSCMLALNGWLSLPGSHCGMLMMLTSSLIKACKSQLTPAILMSRGLTFHTITKVANTCSQIALRKIQPDAATLAAIKELFMHCATCIHMLDFFMCQATDHELAHYLTNNGVGGDIPLEVRFFEAFSACARIAETLREVLDSPSVVTPDNRETLDLAFRTYSQGTGRILYSFPNVRNRYEKLVADGQIPRFNATDRAFAQVTKLARNPVLNVGFATSAVLSKHRCAAPQCGRSIAELGHNLRACGGCRAVFYCTVPCQRQAWRSPPECAHREVCKDMAKYISESGGRATLMRAPVRHSLDAQTADRIIKHARALSDAHYKNLDLTKKSVKKQMSEDGPVRY